MDNILEVSGINKSYDDFSLKDISFYLPEGCITGFVGINGAGKTTTLRSILGLTNNVSGKINFFGMDIKGNESEIKDDRCILPGQYGITQGTTKTKYYQ